MELSEEDIWYFRYNGFYRLPELLADDLIDRLNDITDMQISGLVEPIIWESKQSRTPTNIRRLSKIVERNSAYLEAASHPIVLDALQGVLGPNIELLTNKHNHLMVRPAGSCVVPWHSGEEPYAHQLITVIIYLEESTLDNGCIRLVPGSHMRPFNRTRRPKQDNFQESDLYHRSVPMPMPKGGVLLFDDSCFHGSDKNGSDRSRRSMTLGYQAHSVHNVIKENPEKILLRGEKIYIGHPHPFPYQT